MRSDELGRGHGEHVLCEALSGGDGGCEACRVGGAEKKGRGDAVGAGQGGGDELGEVFGGSGVGEEVGC